MKLKVEKQYKRSPKQKLQIWGDKQKKYLARLAKKKGRKIEVNKIR